MKNLHKFYYKDYFSLDEVLVGNTNRRLDYELLIDDTKKEDLKRQIEDKKGRIKEASNHNNVQLKERLEGEKKELEEQLAVNVNILKVRNKTLTGTDFVIKDTRNRPTRDLSDEVKIINVVSPDDNVNRFSLTIQYPGLVTGVGINHEAKIEGEFKLGVHFEWTYGMPVVYGSSVKGVLRAWFMDIYQSSDKKYYECGIDAGDLMMNIFSGLQDRDIDAEKKKYGKDWEDKVKDPEKRIYKSNKSIYDRDIFFDAVLTGADKKSRIFCSDSITPHGGETHDNPLVNPKPLTFMKIAPGCTMEFRFKLVDSVIGDKKFTAAQKKSLFEKILKTVGIGAKTNVGYGQFKR